MAEDDWFIRYRLHVDRIRSMSAYSEKLVYLFLLVSQPQSFITIRRAMDMSRSSLDRALRRLMENGYVELDETYMYWVAPPQ
jgi:DNA-binding MarR family transcriptional regulator